MAASQNNHAPTSPASGSKPAGQAMSTVSFATQSLAFVLHISAFNCARPQGVPNSWSFVSAGSGDPGPLSGRTDGRPLEPEWMLNQSSKVAAIASWPSGLGCRLLCSQASGSKCPSPNPETDRKFTKLIPAGSPG